MVHLRIGNVKFKAQLLRVPDQQLSKISELFKQVILANEIYSADILI